MKIFNKLFTKSKVLIGILVSSEHEFEKAYVLYRELNKNSKYSPSIILYQISNYHNQLNAANNSLIEKLERFKVRYMKFSNSNDSEVITQLQKCEFYITFGPYVDTYPLGLWKLLHDKKIIYVPYGPLVNYVNYNNPFYDYCWILFVDSNYVFEQFRKLKGDDWVRRCENIGFLGFNTRIFDREDKNLKTNFKFKILITEHWTRLWEDPDPGSTKKTGYCKFEKYAETYLRLPLIFPEVFFIFRPHPYMFENLVNSNVIGKDFKDNFIRKFSSLPNAVYDDASCDFDSIIFGVDALISSGISAWCQFAATNKPALMLLDSPMDDDGLNIYGKSITLGHYRASSDEEIIDFISEVIIRGHDQMTQTRKEIFESLVLRKNCASEAIIACIESRIL
jgi:hypothetical protein